MWGGPESAHFEALADVSAAVIVGEEKGAKS